LKDQVPSSRSILLPLAQTTKIPIPTFFSELPQLPPGYSFEEAENVLAINGQTVPTEVSGRKRPLMTAEGFLTRPMKDYIGSRGNCANLLRLELPKLDELISSVPIIKRIYDHHCSRSSATENTKARSVGTEFLYTKYKEGHLNYFNPGDSTSSIPEDWIVHYAAERSGALKRRDVFQQFVPAITLEN
jgi:hypothetical protein